MLLSFVSEGGTPVLIGRNIGRNVRHTIRHFMGRCGKILIERLLNKFIPLKSRVSGFFDVVKSNGKCAKIEVVKSSQNLILFLLFQTTFLSRP